MGQISSMASDELHEIKERLLPYMEQECGKHSMQMIFFMLTNILEETTELIFCGEGAKELAQKAFRVNADEHSVILKNVVSRKKQLIPAMMRVLQEQ